MIAITTSNSISVKPRFLARPVLDMTCSSGDDGTTKDGRPAGIARTAHELGGHTIGACGQQQLPKAHAGFF
jgi:hypothetical protein